MLNRRKAMIGWLVYTAAKPLAKRAVKSKAKAVVPGAKAGSRTPNAAALLAAAGALLGGLAFWRRRRSKAEDTAPQA
jgi:LPXTG-motif cell wall-anchored protein